MARKSVLLPVKLNSAQSLAAAFTTAPTMVSYQDNVAYQINVTTSDSQGTFTVQASLDYVPNDPAIAGKATIGNWVDLTLSGTPTVAGADDVIMLDLNQIPFNAVRLVYTPTVAGTGVCDIFIELKSLGA